MASPEKAGVQHRGMDLSTTGESSVIAWMLPHRNHLCPHHLERLPSVARLCLQVNRQGPTC